VFAYSNNFNLNAVLSVYLKKAKDEKIHCTHDISLLEALPFDDIDVGLILANGIENAINANMKILDPNHRFIDLKINTAQQYLTILIQNPIETPLQFKDGLPLSKNPGHGFGTLGIKSLAQKFKGSALFSVEKGRFTLIVQLPLID
jgi:sensor histidine kinase regulating citrate/malate metabolism